MSIVDPGDACAHAADEGVPLRGEDDNHTLFGRCDKCQRRIVRFWIDDDDERLPRWSRWRLEVTVITEDGMP